LRVPSRNRVACTSIFMALAGLMQDPRTLQCFSAIGAPHRRGGHKVPLGHDYSEPTLRRQYISGAQSIRGFVV
jgi:hypothetical protein